MQHINIQLFCFVIVLLEISLLYSIVFVSIATHNPSTNPSLPHIVGHAPPHNIDETNQ